MSGEPLNYFVYPYVEVDGKKWILKGDCDEARTCDNARGIPFLLTPVDRGNSLSMSMLGPNCSCSGIKLYEKVAGLGCPAIGLIHVVMVR